MKVRFNRFIPGKPNLITLPLKFTNLNQNYWIGEGGCEWYHTMRSIDVWVFNDDFPPALEIDTHMAQPDIPFRIAELEQIMPDGIILHKKYLKNKTQTILGISSNYNYIIGTRRYPIEFPEDEDKKIDEEGEKPKSKRPTRFLPYLKTTSKVMTLLKEKGADKQAVKEYQISKLKKRREEEEKRNNQ